MRLRSMKPFILFALMSVLVLANAWADPDGIDMTNLVLEPEEAPPVTASDVQDLVEKNTAQPSDVAGGSRRCGFISNQSLSPEFEALIEASCPIQNARTESYCTCVARFMSSSRGSGLSNLVRPREHEMQRVGYQLLLEEWADKYGANILSLAALNQRTLGSQVSGLPNECKPNVMFQRLRMDMVEPSCANSNDAFKDAVNAVLRVRNGRDIFDPLQTEQNRADIDELMARTEELDRVYYPRTRSRTVDNSRRQRNFVDCMGPAEKRAYALLPIVFGSSEDDQNRKIKRRDRLNKMTQEIDRVISSGGAFDKSNFNVEELTPVLAIFPGLQALLDSSSGLSRQDTLEIFNQLKTFVGDLSNPIYQGLRDVRNSAAVMSRMKSKVEEVNSLVSAKLMAANANGQRISEQVVSACNAQSEELRTMACSPENHVGNPLFMALAYEDVNRRGTRPRELNVINFARCQEPRVDSGVDVSDCLVYHQAQCNSLRRFQDNKRLSSELPSNGRPTASATDTESFTARLEMRKELRADEEQMVQLVCADFNEYIRTTACSQHVQVTPQAPGGQGDRSAGIRNGEYLRCALRQTVEQYRAATGGDARLNAFADNGWSSPSVGATIRGSRNVDFGGANEMLAAADAAPVVNTLGTANLTSAIRSATGQFGPAATIAGGPTTPLDIDSPAELRREIEARDRTIETKAAEIAGVNEQIEDATSDSEIARLRRDLAALQADMTAAQTERNAFAARLAEREAASARAVASAEGEDEEDAPAPSRRVDSRGNLVGGGGGISRGPASEGFNIGGSSRTNGSPSTGFSPEFTGRTVDSTFGSTAARSAAPTIREAQALPAVSAAGSQLALRVGTASYAVKDVATVVIPAGTQASEQVITSLILAAKAENKIVLDDQQRAMVEVWDETTQSSRMVYVQFNGEAVAFIPLDQSSEQTAPMRATLAQLEGLLGAGRGAASEGN